MDTGIYVFWYFKQEGRTLFMRRRVFLWLIIALLLVHALPATALADLDGPAAQIGISGVNDYSDSPLGDLGTAIAGVDGIKGVVDHIGTNWTQRYAWYNDNVWEPDFRADSLGGNDYRLADDADLIAYSGHGTPMRTLALNSFHNSQSCALSNMRLGDRDCEWFLTFTCNFLNGTKDQIGASAKGIHAICGYSTVMIVRADQGGVFVGQACYGYRLPVTGAWTAYAGATQPGGEGKKVAYFRANSCSQDRLWGFGSVASDPPPYSSSPSSYELIQILVDII